MGFVEICLLAFGLAMDATAVALSNGMIDCRMNYKKIIFIALCFGIFQGLMPIVGYYFGGTFADFLDPLDNYIVFIVLVILGIRMIIETNNNNYNNTEEILTYNRILIQGIATSIDALLIGITFAIMHVQIFKASLIIILITIILTFIGVLLGCRVGRKLKKKAEILGGIILIALGVRFLITV